MLRVLSAERRPCRVSVSSGGEVLGTCVDLQTEQASLADVGDGIVSAAETVKSAVDTAIDATTDAVVAVADVAKDVVHVAAKTVLTGINVAFDGMQDGLKAVH
eukprot:tig00020556_g11030.t1